MLPTSFEFKTLVLKFNSDKHIIKLSLPKKPRRTNCLSVAKIILVIQKFHCNFWPLVKGYNTSNKHEDEYSPLISFMFYSPKCMRTQPNRVKRWKEKCLWWSKCWVRHPVLKAFSCVMLEIHQKSLKIFRIILLLCHVIPSVREDGWVGWWTDG